MTPATISHYETILKELNLITPDMYLCASVFIEVATYTRQQGEIPYESKKRIL